MSDTVTFYRPLGETPPAYRDVVDIVKLQNVIFNLNLIFNTPEWDGAPLINDDEATTNKAARKPSTAKSEVNRMIRGLGLQAILANTAAAIKLTTANINPQNNKRLDVTITIQLSGNVNVVSIDLNFGFLFGSPELIAA